MEQLGRVDVLVNNAGIGTAYPATRETPEQFREVIDVNLNGCYWMAQACGRVMQPGSAIVNISSVLGLTTAGLPQAAYSASKAGLLGMVKTLAAENARHRITVNAVLPGMVATEKVRGMPPAVLDRVSAALPAGRMAEPAEVAALVAFLASGDAGYITGQEIGIDGGFGLNTMSLGSAPPH